TQSHPTRLRGPSAPPTPGRSGPGGDLHARSPRQPRPDLCPRPPRADPRRPPVPGPAARRDRVARRPRGPPPAPLVHPPAPVLRPRTRTARLRRPPRGRGVQDEVAPGG